VPGTYVLLIECPDAVELTAGALGTHRFPSGWYAYVGSALGPGGFSRVDRHRRSAAGETDAFWHVDYLLGHPEVSLDAVVAAEVDAECAVSATLPEGPIPGFGSSDCSCRSHLAHAASRADLRRVAGDALSAALREENEGTDGADE